MSCCWQVDITAVDDALSVWATLPKDRDASLSNTMPDGEPFVSTIVNCADPRIPEFSRRIITTNDQSKVIFQHCSTVLFFQSVTQSPIIIIQNSE